MSHPTHRTEGVNRTKTARSYLFVFIGEERDEETCYGYCNEYQPHAVKRMFDHENGLLYDMRWDEAGNLGQVSMGKPGEMFERGRFLFWTEDCCGPRPCGANRMHTAVNGKYYSYYAYDYGGERRLKLVGVNSSVDVNAEYMTAVSTLNEPTLYPSAYMVLTNKGYTKHYYAGTERVAARLGGGGNALHHVIENDGKLQTKADSLFDQCLEQVNSRVLKENDLECIMRNKYAKEEFDYRIDGTPYQTKADISFNHRLFKEMAYLMADDPVNVAENDVYFYHSDHLGSASWITDSAGIAVQHLQYLPYGEPYIDQRAAGTTYSERFRFTGKERDEETGYGYFGARYMDHKLMTMWLSVDPMADKYPSISPYAYCAWNPVKLVDPDGMEINPVYTVEGKYLGDTKEGFTGDPLIMKASDYDAMMDISGAENISELSVDDVKKYGGTTFDDVVKSGDALSGDAQEKIIRNIISQYSDYDLTDKYGFNASDVANRIEYDVDDKYVGPGANFSTATYKTGNRPAKFYFKRGHSGYELTVENIICSLVYHEWFGHEKMGWGETDNQKRRASEGGTHHLCYYSVINSPIYNKTTPAYQKFNENAYKYLSK